MLSRQEIDNLYRLMEFEAAWTAPPPGMNGPRRAHFAS